MNNEINVIFCLIIICLALYSAPGHLCKIRLHAIVLFLPIASQCHLDQGCQTRGPRDDFKIRYEFRQYCNVAFSNKCLIP